ncbi:MAG: glycosyltransferase family 4 protein [Patescibacteria group bacterium]
MKIYFVTSKMKNINTAAGSVIMLRFIMQELIKLGNDVACVTVFSHFNDLTETTPFKLIEERISSLRLFPIHWNVFKILKKYENDCDIFYIDGQFMYGGGLYRLLGGKRPVFANLIRPPLVMDEYVSPLFQRQTGSGKFSLMKFLTGIKKKIRWFIDRFMLVRLASRVDFVSAINPILNRVHYKFGLKPAAQALLIGDAYPMVETMEKEGIDEWSYRNRVGKNEKVILYFSGRMAAGKGYDLLLAAFTKVKNKEKFKLVLGGSGPEEDEVRRMIKDFSLEKYVELPGWLSKKQFFEYLKQADIYVFSRWGAYFTSAIALNEAMVFGLPSIVPSGTGLSWTAGKSAVTFEPENADDLARKIELLGEDAELRKELSRRCYERLKEPDIDPRQVVIAMNVLMKSLVVSPKNKYPLERFLNGYFGERVD